MERQLNAMVQEAFPNLLLNPYMGAARVPRATLDARARLRTKDRLGQLNVVVDDVRSFIKPHG